MANKHLTLLLTIGTFDEEDKAYRMLNQLTIYIPIVILVTWIFDALLAMVYLKWLHPWRIIVQTVSFIGFGT